MAGLPSLDSTDLVSQALYARMRGVARQTVADRVAAGQVETFGPRKLICPKLAQLQWADNVRTRPPRVGKGPEPSVEARGATAPPEGAGAAGGERYADASARLQRTNADRAELELDLARGAAIDKATSLAGVYEGFRTLRDRVMAVPRRCARDVVNVGDVREIEMRFEAELRRALALRDSDDMPLPPEIAAIVETRFGPRPVRDS